MRQQHFGEFPKISLSRRRGPKNGRRSFLVPLFPHALQPSASTDVRMIRGTAPNSSTCSSPVIKPHARDFWGSRYNQESAAYLAFDSVFCNHKRIQVTQRDAYGIYDATVQKKNEIILRQHFPPRTEEERRLRKRNEVGLPFLHACALGSKTSRITDPGKLNLPFADDVKKKS